MAEQIAAANTGWRWQFRYRGSRHESAVAQLSTLRPTKRNFMKTWLKCIGSAQKPISGEYNAEKEGVGFRFRKGGKPTVHSGDRLFLYAPGGSKRIFALVEAIGEPYLNPKFNDEEGSCRWMLAVRYIDDLNLAVVSGIHIDEVTRHRRVKLTRSIGRKSHIELHLEESESAYNLMHEKAQK
jgi:hypothetical protein